MHFQLSTAVNSDNQVRVVHITSAHAPLDVRIFRKECKSLARAGYQVTLIAPSNQNFVSDGVRIRALPVPTGRTRRFTVTVWKAFREALREPADIFHLHDPELLPAGLLLALCGKKVIYDCHENVADDFLNRKWIPRGLRSTCSKLADLGEKLATRGFSGIVVADEQLCMRFRNVSVPTAKVQNYPILEEFPANLAADSSRYSSRLGVSFGGVSTWRAIEPSIHAIGMLPEELQFKLILGGGCDSELLLQRVSQLPGWKRVDYRGQVLRKDMIESLTRAGLALVLYKYKDHGDDLDIRSNRLFEALAAGLPVITSNFSRWRDFVEGTGCGLTVDPDEPAQIARALRYLIEHPHEAREMGRRGADAIRGKYNWHSEEERLLALYARLTNGKDS